MSLLQSSAPSSKDFTSCGSLLQELQGLWNEIGENDLERDKTILQLEQDCLDIYRRKVDQTIKRKAELHQALAEGEAEISNLISTLGERESFLQKEKPKGTLKEQVAMLKPLLEELRRKKEGRVKEFLEVQMQIARICAEIAGNTHPGSSSPQVDERDLTVKRLDELKSQLQELQKDKNMRLEKVNANVKAIYQLSTVLTIDFNKMLCEVDPCFGDSANDQPKSISNDTLARLAGTVHSLKQEKKQRLHKLQNLGSTLMELWNLMDIPGEKQREFDHVTSLISASVDEVFDKGRLAGDVIELAEIEVHRLNILKVSKMRELVMKKQDELEEIYLGVHMDVDSDTARRRLTNIIDSGKADLSELLSSMDDQIAKAKEHALSRKDILEKVEKWKSASEEESWLDDYERLEMASTVGRTQLKLLKDQNRYNAGRGAHKNLKRAEKARIAVSKIPSMVENLIAKVKAWEHEKGMQFFYNKVPLLGSLDEYVLVRQHKEDEKRRLREQKRHQEQFAAEQEARFGAKPSPLRQFSAKKPLGQSSSANTMYGTPTNRRLSTPFPRQGIMLSSGKERKDFGSKAVGAPIPVNYVSLPKDDSISRNAQFVSP